MSHVFPIFSDTPVFNYLSLAWDWNLLLLVKAEKSQCCVEIFCWYSKNYQGISELQRTHLFCTIIKFASLYILEKSYIGIYTDQFYRFISFQPISPFVDDIFPRRPVCFARGSATDEAQSFLSHCLKFWRCCTERIPPSAGVKLHSSIYGRLSAKKSLSLSVSSQLPQ